MTVFTAEPAVAPRRPAPTFASSPRREVESARSSVRGCLRLGMRGLPPALGGGKDGLELGERVERALREDGALVVEGDREGGTGDPEAVPVVGVTDLVELDDAQVRMARQRGDRGGERLAEPAALAA